MKANQPRRNSTRRSPDSGGLASMRYPPIATLLTGVVGAIAIVGFMLFAGPAPTAQAQAASDVSLIAIDMNTAGNNTVSCAGEGCAPGTLGATETCAAVAVSGFVNVDIIVDSIPFSGPNPSGAGPNIQGFDMDLIFGTPGIAQVSANLTTGPGGPPGNLSMIHAGTPPGPHSSGTELPPDSNGSPNDYFMSEIDFGAVGESGAGILQRLTLKGLSPGASALHLQYTAGGGPPAIFDNSGNQDQYTFETVQDSLIVVGGNCPPLNVVNPNARRFCVYGSSTGVDWTWFVGPFSATVAGANVASPGLASDIVAAWVGSMNPQFGTALTAIQLTGARANCFEILAGTLTAVPPMTVGTCPVTSSGCPFNPTVFEVSPVGGITELRVDDAGRQSADRSSPATSFPYVALGGALAFGAAAVAAGLWYGRRRWLR